MERMKIDALATQINRIKLKGLEGILCGDSLYYEMKMCPSNISIIRCVGRVMRATFTSRVGTKKEEISKIAFVFSNNYRERKEFEVWFYKIVGLCKKTQIFIPESMKLKISNLLYLPYLFHWYKAMCVLKIRARQKFYLLSVLFGAYVDYRYITSEIEKSNLNLVVVLCDLHLIDSLVVQFCNIEGIDTATLQHGLLGVGRNYNNSFSKYLLGYGEMNCMQAKESGVPLDKVVKVGMPKLIGGEVSDKIIPKNLRTVGVVLSGNEYVDLDMRMINIAVDVFGKLGYKIIIKLHPGCRREHYHFEEQDQIAEIYYTEITIEEFMEKIDIAIMLNSTTYIESLIKMIPTFIFDVIAENPYTMFSDMGWCSFKNENDLKSVTNEFFDYPNEFEAKMLKERNFQTETKEVEMRYKNFFNKFL